MLVLKRRNKGDWRNHSVEDSQGWCLKLGFVGAKTSMSRKVKRIYTNENMAREEVQGRAGNVWKIRRSASMEW